MAQNNNEQQSNYYDWDKTLTHDARIYMVITVRSRGKTYGIRKKFLEWQAQGRGCFCEIFRTTEELKRAKVGWADKLIAQKDVPDKYTYKTVGNRLIRYTLDESNGEPIKNSGEPCGYFVSLSQLQTSKKMTFNNVVNFLFDEAIIERMDANHRYAKDEWNALAYMINTVSRERANQTRKVRLFMLANACDLVNPTFQKLKIWDIPKFGYTSLERGNVCLHYEEPPKNWAVEQSDTLASIMSQSDETQLKMAYYNEFARGTSDYIIRKPKGLKYVYSLLYKGVHLGIWNFSNDKVSDGLYIDNRYIDGKLVIALSNEDSSPNIEAGQMYKSTLQLLAYTYYSGRMFFNSEATRTTFLSSMVAFGMRK